MHPSEKLLHILEVVKTNNQSHVSRQFSGMEDFEQIFRGESCYVKASSWDSRSCTVFEWSNKVLVCKHQD